MRITKLKTMNIARPPKSGDGSVMNFSLPRKIKDSGFSGNRPYQWSKKEGTG